MTARKELQEAYDREQHSLPSVLSSEEEVRIKPLASDLPRVWNDSTTTDADRKTIIRQLVEKIVINIEGETEWVEARIHWAGGHERCSETLTTPQHHQHKHFS